MPAASHVDPQRGRTWLTDGWAPVTGAMAWATSVVIGVIVKPRVWVTGVSVVESAPVTGAMTWPTGVVIGAIVEPSV